MSYVSRYMALIVACIMMVQANAFADECGNLVSEMSDDGFNLKSGEHICTWEGPAEHLSFKAKRKENTTNGYIYVIAYQNADCSGAGTQLARIDGNGVTGADMGGRGLGWLSIDGKTEFNIKDKGYHAVKFYAEKKTLLDNLSLCVGYIQVTPDIYLTTDNDAIALEVPYASSKTEGNVLTIDYANQPTAVTVTHSNSNMVIRYDGSDVEQAAFGDGCGDAGSATLGLTVHASASVNAGGTMSDVLQIAVDGTVVKTVPVTVTVTRHSQTAVWASGSLDEVSITDTVTLSGAVIQPSLNTPVYSSTDEGVVIEGTKMYFTAPGTFTIHASHPGDVNYQATSNDVYKTITVKANTEADLLHFSIAGFSSAVDPTDGSATTITASQQMNIKGALIDFKVSPYATLRIGSTVMTAGTSTYDIYTNATYDAATQTYTLPPVSVTSQDEQTTHTYTIGLYQLPARAAILTTDGTTTSIDGLYQVAHDYFGDRLHVVNMSDGDDENLYADSIVKWYDYVIMPHHATVHAVYRQMSKALGGQVRLVCFQHELFSGDYDGYGWPKGSAGGVTSSIGMIRDDALHYDNYDLFRDITFDSEYQASIGIGACRELSVPLDGGWKQRSSEGSIWEQDNGGFKKAIVLAIDVESALTAGGTVSLRRPLASSSIAAVNTRTLIRNTFDYLGSTTFYDEHSGAATRLSDNVDDNERIDIEGRLIRNSGRLPLHIYDMTGRLVMRADTDVDLNSLPHGIYIVRTYRQAMLIHH